MSTEETKAGLSDGWAQALDLLRAYAMRHGDTNVPQRERVGDFRLGRWVNKARQHRHLMTPAQRALLEDLPGWSWDAHQDRWADHLDALEEYLAAHRRMPPRGETVGELPLGEWVYEQRRKRRQGRLSVERAVELEAVPGFSWEPAPRVGNPKLARPRGPREPDRTVTGQNLRALVEADERLCRNTNVPRIRRFDAPDPKRGLVVMVSGAYHDPDRAFTLTLNRRHTWCDLATAIDAVNGRNDPHASKFSFTRARRIYKETWPPSGGTDIDYIYLPWDYWDLTGPDEPATADLDHADFQPAGGIAIHDAVAALLAPGHAGTYVFNIGFGWEHSIRGLRWTTPEEETQTNGGPPLLAVHPAKPLPPQHYGEPLVGAQHFRSLPLLQLPGI